MGRGAPLLAVLLLAVLGGLGWFVLVGSEPTVIEPTGGTAQEAPQAVRPEGTGTPDPPRSAPEPPPVAPPAAPALEGARTAATTSPIGSPFEDELAPGLPLTPLEPGQCLYRGALRLGGQPLAGARVVLGSTSGQVSAETRSDATGSFELIGSADVDGTLRVEDPAIFTTVYPMPAQEAGRRLNLGLVTVSAADWVLLDVRDPDGRVPEDMTGQTWASGSTHREGLRERDGSLLARLPSNGFLSLRAPGYQPRYLKPELPEDGVLRLGMLPAGRITVELTSSTNEPIQGATVSLVHDIHADRLVDRWDNPEASPGRLPASLAHESRVFVGKTDGEGRVEFNELEEKGYIVLAEHPDHIGERIGFLQPEGAPERPPLVAKLRPAPRLHVAVLGPVDSEDVPKGIRVGAVLQDRVGGSQRWVEASPRPDGTVDLALPELGTWHVEAWAPGFHLASERAVTDYPASLVEEMPRQTIRLEPQAGPGLVVLDPEGLPIGGASATLTMVSKRRRAIPMSSSRRSPSRGAEGLFDQVSRRGLDWSHEFEPAELAALALDLPRGQEAPELLVHAPGYGSLEISHGQWSRHVSVAEDVEGRPLTVRLTRGNELVVVVEDDSGSPIQGAMVYLDHDEAPGNYRQATDANGEARWSGLPSGLVSAKARGQDGTISSKDSGRLGWYGRRQLRLELVLD